MNGKELIYEYISKKKKKVAIQDKVTMSRHEHLSKRWLSKIKQNVIQHPTKNKNKQNNF